MGSVVKIINKESGQAVFIHESAHNITTENVDMFLAMRGHKTVDRDFYAVVITNKGSGKEMQTTVIDIDKLYIRFNKSFWDLIALDKEAGTITIEKGDEQKTVAISKVEFHTEVPKDDPL